MTYFEELLTEGVPDTIPKDGFTFEDMFDEFVASTQKTWVHDRSKSVGASEAFGCIRKTWFSKRGKDFGFTKDPTYKESWGAMRRGDLVENYHVVPAVETGLRRRGMDLILAGEGQNTIVDGASSATLDGLIINAPRDLLSYYGIPDIGSNEVVFEIKSFDPRINIMEEKSIHGGQVQMQMGLLRDKTEYRPNYAVILYVNASWLDDLRPFVVPFDDNIYHIGRRRAEKVFEVDDPGLLGAEGKLGGMCEYCPFQSSCTAVSMKRVPPKKEALTKKQIEAQDTSLIDAIDDSVHRVHELKKSKKDLEREIEEANETVKQALIAANESRVVGTGWKASYTSVAGKRTLSAEKLLEAGLDPNDYMSEGAGFEKLTITMEKVLD
jgi:hypothetical protein